MGKGEIAHYSVFKRLVSQRRQKVSSYGNGLTHSHTMTDWLIDWMVFYAPFNSISVISRQQLTLFMSFLGFTSTRLGLWSVLPKDTPTKNSEDPVRLEPRTPGLRVKHLTTEPSRTPPTQWHLLAGLGKKPFENIVGKGETACTSNFSFSHNVFHSIKDRNDHFCYI